MQISLFRAVQSLAAAIVLAAIAVAQQTPAAPNSQPPSKQSATQSSAKTGQTSAAKKAPAKAAAPLVLKTQKEKASYAMGMNLGVGLHRQGMTLDPALVARGMKDAMTGGKTALTEDEARAALTQLQTEVHQNMMATNRKEGETFLAANKTKEGVVALPSGLQYKVLSQGSGPKPTASDTVTCNYRGTLLNGKEFDSSYKRGHPESFPVGGVIKGWTEALQMMPVGSKWQLFIPADLAYGDRGAPPDIGPGDTLIFEVELLSIGQPKK
jgi:FKBP-type peptidyl-prolyl cis-trans isomerase FklB